MTLPTKILTATLCTLGLGIASSATAKCWWEQYGNRLRQVCDECGNDADCDEPYKTLAISNDCPKAGDIWATVRFQDLNGRWQTGGFWRLAPGQSAPIAYTRNPVYFVYATNQLRTHVWQGKAGAWPVFGRRYAFRKVTAHWDESGSYTQHFACK